MKLHMFLLVVLGMLIGCSREDAVTEKLKLERKQREEQELTRKREIAAERTERSKRDLQNGRVEDAIFQAIYSHEVLPSEESKKALQDAYDEAIKRFNVGALRLLLEHKGAQEILAKLGIAPTAEQRMQLISRVQGAEPDYRGAVLLATADAKDEMQALYDKALAKKDVVSVGILGLRVDAIGDWRKKALLALAREQLATMKAESRGVVSDNHLIRWRRDNPLYSLVLQKAPEELTKDEKKTIQNRLRQQ
jgi:hypothetical protein